MRTRLNPPFHMTTRRSWSKNSRMGRKSPRCSSRCRRTPLLEQGLCRWVARQRKACGEKTSYLPRVSMSRQPDRTTPRILNPTHYRLRRPAPSRFPTGPRHAFYEPSTLDSPWPRSRRPDRITPRKRQPRRKRCSPRQPAPFRLEAAWLKILPVQQTWGSFWPKPRSGGRRFRRLEGSSNRPSRRRPKSCRSASRPRQNFSCEHSSTPSCSSFPRQGRKVPPWTARFPRHNLPPQALSRLAALRRYDPISNPPWTPPMSNYPPLERTAPPMKSHSR
jgi:hypothetical protein